MRMLENTAKNWTRAAALALMVAPAAIGVGAAAAPINAVNSAVQSAIQSSRDDVYRRLRQRNWERQTWRQDAAVSYCARRFRSYDPGSMTYRGYDGLRHRCP